MKDKLIKLLESDSVQITIRTHIPYLSRGTTEKHGVVDELSIGDNNITGYYGIYSENISQDLMNEIKSSLIATIKIHPDNKGKVRTFATSEEFKKHSEFSEKKKLNEKEYAKQHPSEKKHFIFHGGCLQCVTPIHYGLGNCLGCKYYPGNSFKHPDLSIRDLS